MLPELLLSLVPTHVSPDFVQPWGRSDSFNSCACAYGLLDLIVLAPAEMEVNPAIRPQIASAHAYARPARNWMPSVGTGNLTRHPVVAFPLLYPSFAPAVIGIAICGLVDWHRRCMKSCHLAQLVP